MHMDALRIIDNLYNYLNVVLPDEFPEYFPAHEKYHIELEIVNDLGEIVITSNENFLTLSYFGGEGDLEGREITSELENRIIDFLERVAGVRVRTFDYEPNAIVITFTI